MAENGRLLLFLGTEGCGLYEIAEACRAVGLLCGYPRPSLRGPHSIRCIPAHSYLGIEKAIRRFFFDLSLPPIAEAPKKRMTPEFLDYYTRFFARCMGRFPESYICADHLAALVLDVLLAAQKWTRRQISAFFFFANPAREIAILRQKYGQPPPLSEFVWRNTVAAAIRHGGRNLRLVQTDVLNPADWQKLWHEILSLYGTRSGEAPDFIPPTLSGAIPFYSSNLAESTRKLYDALTANMVNPDWNRLENAAAENYAAQVLQGGWQYVDTIDCGLDIYADQFLNKAEQYSVTEEPADAGLPAADAGWLDLLDQSERRLLEARINFESRLFAISSSLHRHYMNMLRDEQTLARQNGGQNVSPQSEVGPASRTGSSKKRPARSKRFFKRRESRPQK